MTRNSRRILGKKFVFRVEDIAPGQLLAYGNINGIHNSDRTALVLRNMVSETSQTRRMIHPSKVLTPFSKISIDFSKYNIEDMLRSSESFKIFGIVEVEEVISTILRKERVENKLYNREYVRKIILKKLPVLIDSVGKGLLVDIHRYSFICTYTKLSERRLAILKTIVPRHLSFRDFLESQNEFEKNLLLKLAH